jgi:hypothetical protein
VSPSIGSTPDAAELTAAAGSVVTKLEAAGLKVEAAKADELQTALKNSQSACEDSENIAGRANELAEELQADGHLEVADDMQKLADAIARSAADRCNAGDAGGLALGVIAGITAGGFVCLCVAGGATHAKAVDPVFCVI